MRVPLLLLAFVAGCIPSVPQPGQTPAQVAACQTNATAHTAALIAGGSLSIVGGALGVAALQNSDEAQQKGLGYGVLGVAASAAIASLISGLTVSAYATDGCQPAITTTPSRVDGGS